MFLSRSYTPYESVSLGIKDAESLSFGSSVCKRSLFPVKDSQEGQRPDGGWRLDLSLTL